jgi:putative DNA primase/helicase
MIGQMSDKQTLICEGFATGASIQADTGHLVLIAFNAANLIKVAVDFHKHFPDKKILVCGDDDWLDPLNPGKTAAIEAARAVGGKYLLPEFGEDRQPGWTDFNDLLNRGVA